MPPEHECPECGAALSADAPQGLCPRCLMTAALAPIPVAAGQQTVRIEADAEEEPSQRIGRYKILQKLGEGGCGVVYMAEQTEPVRRKVALKVIKPGMDTKQVIARFEAERQALALMDHPNIAKVLDAGTTEMGRPYFVMELVKGIRITDYCDQHLLPPAERLGLFTQVCQAIQHAHQKGIIHRDIKPSNILVTLHDGVPVPKVIDFGIAKATEQPLTTKTVFTAVGQFMGTPAYMSPEQAELSGLDIDTRSDIYALGVLLYELLTGKTPFDARELLQAGLDEMRRRIREEEPVRPSTRLSTMVAADLTEIAHQRQSEPAKLTRFIRGDLDWIVMKCLEKDRNRRYETANGLAMDLRRHLNNEPVVACPPSAAYRFQKLVRRNKLAFGAASLVAATVVLGVVVSTWQAVRATRAQKLARIEATKTYFASVLIGEKFLGLVEAVRAGGSGEIVRNLMDDAIRQLDEASLQDQPEAEAYIRSIIASTYLQLKEYEKAEAIHRQALAIRKRVLGEDHKDVAVSLNHLGQVLFQRRDYRAAESMHRDALAIAKSASDQATDVEVESLWNLGWARVNQDDAAGAGAAWREALESGRRLWPNNPKKWESLLQEVSGEFYRQDRLQAAELLFGDLLAKADLTRPQISSLLRLRGDFRARQGNWREAAVDLVRYVEIQPDDHSYSCLLASLLLQTGDLPGYEKHRKTMLSRFCDTKRAHVAERVAKATALHPLSGDDLTAASRLSERSVAIGTNDAWRAYYEFAKGLTEYRAGNHSNAVLWLQHSLGAKTEHLGDTILQAQRYFVLALAQMNLNQMQDSRNALQSGTQVVQEYFPQFDRVEFAYHWHDVLIANFLMREAIQAYQSAAEQGNAWGQTMLGWMYENGKGVTNNAQQAVDWYRKAADQGSSLAQASLGEMHFNGRGVTRNPVEAGNWYQRAAGQGNILAQNRLGWMYTNGDGVAQDAATALGWYRKAADQGDPQAQANLGVMYQAGLGTETNYAEAVKWFRKAADQGSPGGQCGLGAMYLEGNGVPQNVVEATQWFRKAAEQGDAGGQCRLGIMMDQGGPGLARDYAEAASWLRKSAEQGDPVAESSLAWLLATCGDAAVRDGQAALTFAEKAVERTKRKDPGNLNTLAAAYAEAGEFTNAARAQAEAIALLTTEAAKNDYVTRLNLYRANTPYREPMK